MDSPPRVFRSITRFAVRNVEKKNPRLDCITKLTLTFQSKIPSGEYSLVLVNPFPPFGRAGASLGELKSLLVEDIDSIEACPGPGHSRVEIITKTNGRSSFDCEAIEGLPDFVDTAPQSLSQRQERT